MIQVLDKVRQLYEEHPYPPPETDLEAYKDRQLIPAGAPCAFYHLFWPERPYRDDLDMLIAGCGTSQATIFALNHPRSSVVGIDVSETSLAHTRRLADRYGADNLELHHLPIEQVGTLDRDFDFVASTGVLHHLDDPSAGLKALHDVTRPDGALYLMVYATYGRAGVYMMQSYCRMLGLEPTDSDVDGLRSVVRGLPAHHPLSAFAANSADLATTAGMADLFLNPRDRSFTVPQVHDWLDACGLDLQRWYYQAPYQPQCSVLRGGPHMKRLNRMPEAQQHAAVELVRGDIAKHQFVACRRDRSGGAPCVEFDSDDHLGYVPIRYPGVTIDQENLPDRAVARLRHLGHGDLDISTTIDHAELLLYQAIDGQRTIGRIAEAIDLQAALPVRRRFARQFFERMWWFDQVFFRTAC